MDFIELREAISLEYDKRLESLVLGKAGAVLKRSFPDVAIDEEKLKQWFLQEQSLHSEVEYLRNKWELVEKKIENERKKP